MDNANDNFVENDGESGLKGAQNLNRNQMDLLKKLAAIGSDLWGGMPSAAYQKEEAQDKPAQENRASLNRRRKKKTRWRMRSAASGKPRTRPWTGPTPWRTARRRTA